MHHSPWHHARVPPVSIGPLRALGLGSLSAVLLCAAFPPFELVPISWVALVPLLFAVVRVESTANEVLLAGGAFGFALFAFELRWFYAIFGAPAVVFWAVLAFFLARTLWLAWRIGQRWGERALVLAIPVLWTGVEHLRSECWPLAFGWITPGYAQASDSRAVQAAEIFGVYGLTFVVVLASSLSAWGTARAGAPRLARGLAVLAVPVAYSVLAAYGAHRSTALEAEMVGEPRVRVAAIQYETNSLEDGLALLDRVPEGTQLVVFPELGAVYRDHQLTYVEAFEGELRARALTRGAVLVVGAERRAPGGNPVLDFYNTLAIIAPHGPALHYTKAEPVPLFADGVASDDVHAYDTELGRLGFAICYDFTHPHVVDALRGARAFVVASGDLASWSELQHRQHALVTRLRAVEHRRWFVRATSSGYSQIVDPNGRVHGELGFEDVGMLTGEIGLRETTTLYDAVGLWPARLCLAAWLIAAAMELGRALRERTPALRPSPGDPRVRTRA